MEIQRILCPVDFSESSRVAMQAAIVLARERGAMLVLMHVLEHPPWLVEATVYAPVALREHARAAATQHLAVWRAEAVAAGVEVATKLVEGLAWDQIAVAAREDPRIEMIVMGTHGRTGFDRAMIGSVAERVVRQAPCAVLVVPEARR